MAGSMPTIEEVQQVIAQFADPETGQPLVETGQAGAARLEGEKLIAPIALTTHSAPLWEATRQDLADRLKSQFAGLGEVEIELSTHERPAEKRGQIELAAKSVIAVGSGKGGVGKSTLAVATAVGLARAGSKVGLMDADVYGPSIPHLLGLEGRPEIEDQKIVPKEKHGLKVMSMGFMVPPGEAVVWRGPMLHGAITQFLRDTELGRSWTISIIDMPPGTGDIALTLSQLLAVEREPLSCARRRTWPCWTQSRPLRCSRKVNIQCLGHGREHERVHLPRLPQAVRYFRCGRRAAEGGRVERAFPGRGAA